MKNTDWYFMRAKEYQDKRGAIIETYEKRLASLEDHKGSKYYADEVKKAQDKRDAALAPLKEEYMGYFQGILGAMKRANANRKMNPPTEEQLRTLQLLKMKEAPSYEELRAAANTMKDNATCLSILTEIAHKAGHMKGFSHLGDAALSTETVDNLLKEMAISTRDFLDFDTSRVARVAEASYKRGQWGYDGTALAKRARFEDKAGCYSELHRIKGDDLTAFESAVDEE